jgi:hypothetical protein
MDSSGECHTQVFQEGQWVDVEEHSVLDEPEIANKVFTVDYGHGVSARTVNGSFRGAPCAPELMHAGADPCALPDDKIHEWRWDMGQENTDLFQGAGDALIYYRDVVAPQTGFTIRHDSSLDNNTDVVFYGLDSSQDLDNDYLAYYEVNSIYGTRDIKIDGSDTGHDARIVNRGHVWYHPVVISMTREQAESVTCHEFGHSLGLPHSIWPDSCMYKNISNDNPRTTLRQYEIDYLNHFSGNRNGTYINMVGDPTSESDIPWIGNYN